MIYLMIGIAATSGMTLFSYMFYYFTKQESREPKLLAAIISQNLSTPKNRGNNESIGWVVHFITGIVFLGVHYLLISIFRLPQHPIYGLLLGIIIGFLGVLGWKIAFSKYGRF